MEGKSTVKLERSNFFSCISCNVDIKCYLCYLYLFFQEKVVCHIEFLLLTVLYRQSYQLPMIYSLVIVKSNLEKFDIL